MIPPKRKATEIAVMQDSLYDHDLYRWAMETARLVRAGRFGEVDIVHLAEELESMGKTERRALESRLVVLLVHLLKWQFQPERRSRSWERTLTEQRKQIGKLLADSPSLRPLLPDLVRDAYDSAVRWAADETGRDEAEFPADCPYPLERILALDFRPAD
jgi:hypothetical protein